MCKVQSTKSASKPRSFRVVQFPSGPMPGVLSMVIGNKVDTYAFRTFEVSTLMGKIGIEFTKLGISAADRKESDEPHHVLILCGNVRPQCDCIGHLQHGHCKHSDVAKPLLAAIEKDRKPQPNAAPAPKGFPCNACGRKLVSDGFRWQCLACDHAEAETKKPYRSRMADFA
jgi:hypothetical protein